MIVSCSYRFLHPLPHEVGHVFVADGQLAMEALAVGRGDQPDVLRLLVSLDCYHSSVKGLKPIASNFSTSPGVGGGGVGLGSVLIILSSSIIMSLALPIF